MNISARTRYVDYVLMSEKAYQKLMNPKGARDVRKRILKDLSPLRQGLFSKAKAFMKLPTKRKLKVGDYVIVNDRHYKQHGAGRLLLIDDGDTNLPFKVESITFLSSDIKTNYDWFHEQDVRMATEQEVLAAKLGVTIE